MDLSRFKVARLLDRAREEGWVRVEVVAPSTIDPELSDAVRERFRLRHAVVVDEMSAGSRRAAVAGAAAQFLSEVLTSSDTLGLAWSRTVAAMVDRLGRVPACPVVQLTGALAQADSSSIELVRRFASISGAPAYLYYSPMILTSAEAAASMRAQPEIARTIALMPEVTVATVAIGAWEPGGSTVHQGVSPGESAALAAEGVVAEISGIFVHHDGQAVHTELTDRMLAPEAASLGAIPHVIALSSGPSRAASFAAALRTGLVHSLVIDAQAARDLVSLPEDDV